jgi:hypothetical protein
MFKNKIKAALQLEWWFVMSLHCSPQEIASLAA